METRPGNGHFAEPDHRRPTEVGHPTPDPLERAVLEETQPNYAQGDGSCQAEHRCRSERRGPPKPLRPEQCRQNCGLEQVVRKGHPADCGRQPRGRRLVGRLKVWPNQGIDQEDIPFPQQSDVGQPECRKAGEASAVDEQKSLVAAVSPLELDREPDTEEEREKAEEL